MGFFSSRKAEDNYITSIPATDTSRDKSVIHVIRSRFYGKNKGKEREEKRPLPSFAALDAPTAQTLSNPKISTHIPVASSPLARNNSSGSGAAGSSTLRDHHDPFNSSTPPRITHLADIVPSPSPSPQHRTGSSAALKPLAPSTLSPRNAIDTVTVTLAQRLNELALANSEGLLNDDEYRLLRQNLFERFASSTIVPCETPVVPATRSRHRAKGQGTPPTRPLSNFQVEVQRSPSINSKTSVTSGVATFLRRATSRRTPTGSKDPSEASSMMSSGSKAHSMFKPRGLSQKSSASSVHTAISRTQTDNMSILSRQTGVDSDRAHSDFSQSVSRSTATSIRRLAAPPSSFPTRAILSDNRYAANINEIFDEEHLKTATEIRQEILTVEAEAKRLMDAFNGLELTTLARVQRRQGRPLLAASNVESVCTLVPDGRSQRRVGTGESDSGSVRSATSAGTGPSMSRSMYSGRKAVRAKGSWNPPNALSVSSKPGSLQRKDSSSTTGSQEWRTGKPLPLPPALSGTASYGHLDVANTSNVSLARSTGQLTMHIVPEDKRSMSGMATRLRDEDGQFEGEIEDIQRRREDVGLRYEARLEYLRAKLKGAQLHEKLLKK